MNYFWNMNKKAVSILLLIALIISIMVGCVQPVEDEMPNAVPTDEVTAQAPSGAPGAPDPVPAPSDITPLFWRVTSPDGQGLYLFGSIHAGTEDIYPLPDVIMEAFNSSDFLAVEVDMVAFEADVVALAEMSLRMMYTDGGSIADEIGEVLHARASLLLADLMPELEAQLGVGFPIELLDGFKPYFWMQLFTAVAIERAGLSFDYGLDVFFLNQAKERGMEIIEIESAMEQIDMLLGFSPPLQAELMEGHLKVDQGADALRGLFAAWRRGDRQEIEEWLEADYTSLTPVLMDEYLNSMLTQRDLGMVAAAERFMAEGKKVFYVVGLAHMIGENGIVEQLTRNGYTVEQILGR
jgi:hypothetical protein